MTHDLLKQLRINDNDLFLALGARNKTARKKNKAYKTIDKRQVTIPIPEGNNLNKFKLNYINKRLGTDLGFDDLPRFKLILNLYDLLDENRITFLTNRNENFVDTLDRNFLGFLSYDNNYLIMRNLSKKIMPDLRYYNYNVFNQYDNSKRFYILPNKIDLLEPKVNVIISEGIFDILGVYFHVEKENLENTIYVAVNGIGYNLIFMELARMGFLDMNIKIYSDSDQPISLFKSIKKEMGEILTNKIEVIYNKKEKDFGVTPDKILTSRAFI